MTDREATELVELAACPEHRRVDLTATCPVCEKQGCKVKQDWMQATRTESRRSLGHSGYCPDCMVSFRITHAQTRIS